ncbi:MAG TPA: glycosyltransferase family 9 protein [Patescibacteria group bacterium]|nr:glycosyltransferase family 9 protein [Patescibacteria group bacterium]
MSKNKKSAPYKRIAVFGHSNIGDVCYDLAVVEPLAKAFPSAEIFFLTSSVSAALARGYRGLSGVITFDRHGKDKGLPGRLRFMRALRRERFDLAVVLSATHMHRFLGIPHAWRLTKRWRFDRTGAPVHVVDAYLALLRAHGTPVQKPVFDFGSDPADASFAEGFLRDYRIRRDDNIIGILPLSNWSLKCWHIAHWNALISELIRAHNAKVIVFGKSGADAYTGQAIQGVHPQAASAIDACTLKQSMALIAKCRLFVSADTSLLHIASCMGVPCIGLFGATDAAHYYPYFSRGGTLRSSAGLACMPCGGTRHFAVCKAKDGLAPCMEGISVSLVLDKIKSLINS